jgi:catechol 2,3-dioxygenase-like lactoylglutathione lyase family enzyme
MVRDDVCPERAAMNLVSLRLITDDVTRLATFYERITGVAAERPNDDFAELRTPNGTLAIGSTRTVAVFGPGSARPAANHTAIIEFLVHDVDAVYASLRADGVEPLGEPRDMPWGNRSLLVRDPDGTLVNLFTPVTPAAIAKFAETPR